MVKPIVRCFNKDFQLVSLGIEIVHKVLGLQDCLPGAQNNPHFARAYELAQKWNDLFIDLYVKSSRDGGQKNG